MTLHDFKDTVCMERWNCNFLTALVRRSPAEIIIMIEDAAELYARSKWDDGCEEQVKFCEKNFFELNPYLVESEDVKLAILNSPKPGFKP